MIRMARAAALAVVMSAALFIPARAIVSGSLSYRNNSNVIDAGGARKTSPSYRGDASVGAISIPSGLSIGYSNRDGYMAMAFMPGRINDLVVISSCGSSSVLLKWTAPGNDGYENTTAGAFILRYSTYAAGAPSISNATFEAATNVALPPAPGIMGTAHTLNLTGLTPGIPYYFAIKTAERDALRSIVSNSVATIGAFLSRLAAAPFGIGLSTAGATATVTWQPVRHFGDHTSFVVPAAPTPGELSGYRVYRSTTPILATWVELATVSTNTLAYTDPAALPNAYYAVRSQTYDGCLSSEALSSRSLIRSAATFDAYSVAPDDQSYFHIPKNLVSPLVGTPNTPDSAYAIETSSQPGDLGGRIYKSLDFAAFRGGYVPDANFALDGMGMMYLHYDLAGSSLTPSFAGSAATPYNASVYWYNGVKYLQLYGKGDSVAQNLFLDTKYFGKYQIRAVERAAGFSFSAAGLSNKFVTPNGDGKNDTVVFTFDNPRGTPVKGRILDMSGRVVTSDLRPGPVHSTLEWDGASNGRSVPGGIYIYQLEGEGQSYSGTLVILK